MNDDCRMMNGQGDEEWHPFLLLFTVYCPLFTTHDAGASRDGSRLQSGFQAGSIPAGVSDRATAGPDYIFCQR